MRLLMGILLLTLTARAEDTEFQTYADSHPKMLSAIFGASICLDRATRAAALTEIAKEKKYSKVGGVENKSKLYELQKQVRWADETEQKDIKDAKSWKVKPAPCTNVVVKLILDCKLNEDRCDDTSREASTFIVSYEDDTE